MNVDVIAPGKPTTLVGESGRATLAALLLVCLAYERYDQTVPFQDLEQL